MSGTSPGTAASGGSSPPERTRASPTCCCLTTDGIGTPDPDPRDLVK